MKRKEGGRGLCSVELVIKGEVNSSLEEFVLKGQFALVVPCQTMSSRSKWLMILKINGWEIICTVSCKGNTRKSG